MWPRGSEGSAPVKAAGATVIYRSTIGKKMIVHMLGNLKIFFGATDFNRARGGSPPQSVESVTLDARGVALRCDAHLGRLQPAVSQGCGPVRKVRR
jgi:hypothetical protein